MVETVLLVAVVLLAAAVAGSLLPVLPSGLLSLAGIAVYQFAGPGLPALVALVLGLVALLAAVLDYFAGPLAARASGASTETTAASAVGGVVGLLLAGPVGVLAGVLAVVFALELRNGAEPRVAARRALYGAAGVLGSAAMQLLLTLSILLAFLAAVYWL